MREECLLRSPDFDEMQQLSVVGYTNPREVEAFLCPSLQLKWRQGEMFFSFSNGASTFPSFHGMMRADPAVAGSGCNI